jgi:hypothetical protein
MPGSSSTARCRAPSGSFSAITALTAPVPGPNSTTTGSPARGTTDASTAPSRGELGAIAPMVAGRRSAAARNARRADRASAAELVSDVMQASSESVRSAHRSGRGFGATCPAAIPGS